VILLSIGLIAGFALGVAAILSAVAAAAKEGTILEAGRSPAKGARHYTRSPTASSTASVDSQPPGRSDGNSLAQFSSISS
jgi:hypothetical protein